MDMLSGNDRFMQMRKCYYKKDINGLLINDVYMIFEKMYQDLEESHKAFLNKFNPKQRAEFYI